MLAEKCERGVDCHACSCPVSALLMLMLANRGGAGISAVSSQACALCGAGNGTHHQQGSDTAEEDDGRGQGKLRGLTNLPSLEREQYCIVGRDLVVSLVPGSRDSPPTHSQSAPLHPVTEGLAKRLFAPSMERPSRSSAAGSKRELIEATAAADDGQDAAALWTQHWGMACC